MSNVNANINIVVNSEQATAQLRALQSTVTSLNRNLNTSSAAALAQQNALNKALMDGANASRMWNARIVPLSSSVDQFTTALDKGKMSLTQYTRYAASQLPGMRRVLKNEFEMMTQVAESNVKKMQTQYVSLGNAANGAAQALALTPTALNRQAASTEIAIQRQMMMNRMIDLGTTKLLNWGKNTQWAGRQLMVGFSIPLAMMGAAAAKAFQEIDKSSIAFRRVYGDLQTTTAEMEANLDAVKQLGEEYTKYGRSLSEVIQLSADVAATGARNEDLTAATEQTLRLATLGLMENAEALEAVTALQTAFGVNSADLAQTIDFLNVVENETVLTMQDMAAAIPRVAPVVKGLGGDVKDLAVFMTAMREGGISAEQGANALKSGLGRLINPTKAAREEAEKYGISIDAIVQRNRGDLMGTVTEFGDALTKLGSLEQQQVLQKVFGTYQYARLGALFKNISNDAGQAQRTMELTAMSVEDLATISERELGRIEEATSTKFAASIERLKIAIAPIGETFMKALMPIIDFASDILTKFNELPEGIKNAIAIAVGAIAGIGPVVLMTVGLIANGIANVGKLIQTMRKFFARLRGDASSFEFLTQQEIEAQTAANSLSGATENLTGKFLGQQKALSTLIGLVDNYAKSLSAAASAAPLAFGFGAPGNVPKSVVSGPRTGGTVVTGPRGMRMANGGVVPGTGNKDTVPAVLTPGESVVTKEATQKFGPIIQAMNAGTVRMLNGGEVDTRVQIPQSSQSSGAKLVFAHGMAGTELTESQLRELKSASGSAYVREAARATALSNFGFVTPESFNKREMTGPQAARLFTDKRIVDRTMYPMYAAIARQLGNMTPEQAMQDPAIRGDVRRFATGIARNLYFQTGKIGDREFYEAADRALVNSRMSASSRAGIEASKKFTTVALYPPSEGSEILRGRGERIPLGREIQQRVFGETGQVSYRSQKGLLQRATMAIAGPFRRAVAQSMGNQSPSVHAQSMVTQYVDGLEVGAAKNTGDSAKAGKMVGTAFAASVKQSILSGQTAPGLIPGAAKKAYRESQSASRREAFNIREMQRVGMTDTQILRQLERLKASKEKQALAQERQIRAEQANARQAAINASLAEATRRQMVVQEQVARKGLRSRVSDYFNAPVGDGTQTRGQAMRDRAGRAAGGASMALMGLTMAASFAGGAVGEMAQKLMPAVMAASAIQMLGLKTGLAALAVTALVGSLVYMRKSVDEAAKSAAKMAASQGGAANRMEQAADAFQYKFAADRVGNTKFRFTEADKKAQSEFSPYFESEGGQKFIEELKSLSSEERYARIASQISFAIADGLDPAKAKAFGQGIAAEINDSLLNSKLMAMFARGEFGVGSQAMIDLIAQRQNASIGDEIVSADLRAGLSGGERAARFADKPVTESINFLTRGLADFAGTADTTTDILGKAALTVGATAGAATAVGAAFFGVGAPIGAVIGTLGGLAMAVPVALEELDQLEKNTASVAASFSSTIQVLKEVDNAEALLLEERRKGLITAKEYARREAELNEIKNKQAEKLGKAIQALVDQGANEQAIVDQLVLGGFDEATAGAVARATDKEQLAKQLFGGQSYEEIGPAGQNFINTVVADLLSGLTPENAADKIAEIEFLYKDIAQQIVDGAIEGVSLDSIDLSALQKISEEERYASGIKSLLPSNLKEDDGPFGRSLDIGAVADTTAKNLMKLKGTFADLGTSGQEVFNTLASFGDPQLIARIGRSEDELTRLAKTLSVLDEYKQIDLELVMDKNIDPEQLKKSLDKMKKTVFKKDGFFDANELLPNPQAFANAMIELGKNVNDIPRFYMEAAQKTDAIIEKLGKDIFTKIGTIKPKILPQVLVEVLGTSVDQANQISSVLNDAFPNKLTDIQLSIALAFSGDPQALALLKNRRALEAAQANLPTFEEPVQGPYPAGVERPTVTVEVPSWLNMFANAGSDGTGSPFDDKGSSGSGGEKEKTALEKLLESIKERSLLYLALTKEGKKLNKKRASFAQMMAETTTVGSIADQLRKMNLSENLIAQILDMGAEEANKVIKQLGKKGLKELDRKNILSLAGEAVSNLDSETEVAAYAEAARARLEQTGQFTKEEIDQVIEDEGLAEILAKLPKKAIPLWNDLVGAIKRNVDATKEIEDPLEKAEARLRIILDLMEQAFDAEELKAMDAVAATFFSKNAALAKKLADSTGQTVSNGYELASAMERQISLNQRLIDAQQKIVDGKQEEVDDYQRSNDLIQQGIDDLRRQDEMRNRRSESLSRDLEQIAEQEEKIRKQNEERVKALDKVAQLNQFIVEQQQKQVNLSRAIAEGDIYSAAGAIQDMRAGFAQQSIEQRRAALDASMQSQIAGLTNDEGMTRADIEAEIANIKEQNYQNSLRIRIEEDKIYANNLEIRRLTNEIYNIQENIIEPLENQNKEYQKMLDYYKEDEAYAVSRVTLAGMTRDQYERQSKALLDSITNAKNLSSDIKNLVGDYWALWAAAKAAADEAARLATPTSLTNPSITGTNASGVPGNSNSNSVPMYAGGMAKKRYAIGGTVFGNGGRDSVPAMLTPGEFVIRKAMVDKYGAPMLDALNTGSFVMPTYRAAGVPQAPVNVMSAPTANINAPVYNTYDMKFMINGTNASVDEIANKVMFKMNHAASRNIRSNRA